MGSFKLWKGVSLEIRRKRLDEACQARGFVNIHNTEFVAANVFFLFMGTWVFSLIIDAILKFHAGYRQLNAYHKRNCITYIIEIVSTTAVLVLQIVYGWNNMVYGVDTNEEERKGLSYAALLMTGLYTYELAYRIRTHWQLAVHHAIAIGVLLVAFYNWYDYPEHHAPVVRMCCIFVLHATTEQACFLALLLHRLLDHHKHSQALMYLHLLAALTSYVMKTTICIVTWFLWIPLLYYPHYNEYLWFWKYVFPVLNTVMLFVQWWASSIFFTLSRRFQKMKIRESDLDNINYKSQVKKFTLFSTVDMSDLNRRDKLLHLYKSFDSAGRYITS
mmetsp:Transcript_31373/g.55161  ORF Transcript_31373/g.55161 Transcript_31373/m.55161 type:complete len:331 (-) Transcript_31373:165-1157(-)